jgi:hypothetical protein
LPKAAEGGLGWPAALVGTSLSGFSFRAQALSIPELGALVPCRGLGTKVGVDKPKKLSGSPEVGEATSIFISALISISEIDGVAEADLSSEVGDAGLSSSPVFIGDGHGGIGVDVVIVHGLLVLGFLTIGCPRKFLLTIGIFRVGAGAKLCNDVDDKGA